jgi:hypothetical protein
VNNKVIKKESIKKPNLKSIKWSIPISSWNSPIPLINNSTSLPTCKNHCKLKFRRKIKIKPKNKNKNKNTYWTTLTPPLYALCTFFRRPTRHHVIFYFSFSRLFQFQEFLRCNGSRWGP